MHEFEELVIVATAIVILVAGYETTGTTLAYAAYQLAKSPEIQEKLRTEIEAVAGDAEVLTYEHTQNMTYLDQVIHETLRFFPIIGVLMRSITKPYTIHGK